jgi:hypothetical protein
MISLKSLLTILVLTAIVYLPVHELGHVAAAYLTGGYVTGYNINMLDYNGFINTMGGDNNLIAVGGFIGGLIVCMALLYVGVYYPSKHSSSLFVSGFYAGCFNMFGLINYPSSMDYLYLVNNGLSFIVLMYGAFTITCMLVCLYAYKYTSNNNKTTVGVTA